jgi:hypothetical protein
VTVHTWRCRRVKAGVRCDTLNLARKKLCTTCGKARPPRSRPKHMAALDAFDYDAWVAEYGERCAICGTAPKDGKRLHRDHSHVGAGFARGLLCFQCNRKLGNKTSAWLRQALAYLEAAEYRQHMSEENREAA